MRANDRSSSQSPDSLLDGLERLADALGALADQDGSVERSVHVGAGGTEAVVGARVRTNIAGEARASGPGEEARRPAVDVDVGDERVRVVAEMPGVGPDALEWTLDDRTLTLTAQTERRRYRRAVRLPRPVAPASAVVTVQNGLVELSFDVAGPAA
jgi:HSP20 family molecular chaperone IbpA